MFGFKKYVETVLNRERFPWLMGISIYTFSYFQILLLGNTYFWDDWLNRITKEEFASKARLSGFPPTRELIEFDLLGNSGVAFRFVTFACYFVAAVCLHRILKCGLHLTMAQVNVISLIFLVVPINSTRAAMIIMHYSISLALFYCAWALLVSRRVTVQVASIPIFWWSFGTPSLLPFFLLPLAHWILLNRRSANSLKDRLVAVLLVLTPFSYWVVRSQTFGSGVREYYVPRPLGVIRGGLLVSLVLLIVLYGLRRRKWALVGNNRPLVTALGLVAISLGASAYMAGGHLVDISDWMISFIPNFSDWDSRHQLLLGLGVSLLVGSAVTGSGERSGQLQTTAFLGVLAFCCLLNFTFGQEYQLDSLKQREIIAELKEFPELETMSAIMIDDQSLRFNARGRNIRSYEWEQMINFSLERRDAITVEPLRYVNCSEFRPEAILTISAKNGRLESSLFRRLGITLTLDLISPCS